MSDRARALSLSILLLSLVGGAACAHPQALSPAARDAAVRAYHALTPQAIQAKKIAALPPGSKVTRIDVSSRFRSASFGHTTTLLVPSSENVFYVEYGPSTNRPGALFGPFAISRR